VAYHPAAGRAARDGAPARCLLFAEGRDKGLHVFFIQRGEVHDAEVVRVARLLARAADASEPPRLDEPAPPPRYDVALGDLVTRECEEDAVRAILGHLARAAVIQPAPSTPDRARGRIVAPFDARARAACRSFAGEAQNVRWRQYRSVWSFVESDTCRRRSLLRHFGDRSDPQPEVPCCDVCAEGLVPAAPAPAARLATSAVAGNLDDAILDVVQSAEPTVGRTRAVEILRGGRSKVVRKYSYDGLPGYGAFAHLSNDEVLQRVDELITGGRLRSTGGPYPKLELVP
jgi:ATP-dependent DNA helicase RecQ